MNASYERFTYQFTFSMRHKYANNMTPLFEKIVSFLKIVLTVLDNKKGSLYL